MSEGVSLGTAIYSAVRPIFKVYFILITGFVLAKRQWLSVETARNLSNMVLICFMPCLVINKVITYIDNGDIKQIGIVVLSAFVMYASGFLYAFLLQFVLPVPKRWKGGFIVGCTLPNVSDLPIAYLQSMAGGVIFSDDQAEKGVAYIIIYLATYIVVQFSCGLFRLVEYDFRELPPDAESKLSAESSDDDAIRETESYPDGEHPEAHRGEDSGAPKQELDELNRMASRNRRLAGPALPPVDDAGVILSPTSTLSSASTTREQDLAVVPLGELPYQSRPLRSVHSNASRRRPRRASMESRSTRSSVSASNELVREYSRLEPYNSTLTQTMSIITENVSSKIVKDSGASIKFVRKYKLGWLVFMLKNFLKPASMALIFSITVAMIPWVKALFVTTTVYMPSAPDDQPPLTFIMDYTGYLGQAAVPLGLLLLGGTIARLEITSIPKGFWQCVLSLVGWRLCIMPIWGVLWCNRLKDIGWIDGDNLLAFVLMLQWSLPSATVQVYLTATYTDPESEDHIQMDCLAIYILSQYAVLCISLPFLVTYAIKVNLNI